MLTIFLLLVNGIGPGFLYADIMQKTSPSGILGIKGEANTANQYYQSGIVGPGLPTDTVFGW